MNKKVIITAATIISIAVVSPLSTTAYAQQNTTMTPGSTMKGQGKAQQGMGQGMGQGHGGAGSGSMMKAQKMGGMKMMGQMMRMRKKMMGKMFMVRKKPYSNADIKRMIDGRLAKHGFSKLLVGDVKNGAEKMPKTAIVSVVSPKGELLFKVEVNRKNAMAAIIE